ncbi:MAG: glucose-1-phosphate adenylyltransferase family protein [Ilumatobacteraceae bacterium]
MRMRVLVVVLAGGAGSRLAPLTDRLAKPAVPFGGMCRLIDITLSNIANSGLSDVWVIEQYEPHALNDHLANGRPWDLDRTHGGLQILPPFQGQGDDDTLATGNADALVLNRAAMVEFGPDVVITMSADHVYRLDLRDVLDTHHELGATLTVVTTDPPDDEDASRFAWVSVDGPRITGFEYKPEEPVGDRVCTEVFCFDGPALLERLEHMAGAESGGDYGEVLLPALVADAQAVLVEHFLDGYWRDVGTIGAYHRAHMELIGDDAVLSLDDPAWPFLTGSVIGGPARVAEGASVERALLAPGVRVAGAVSDSVLGRNVWVEHGATVTSSVVLDDAVIRSGAVVERAIVDGGVTVRSSHRASIDQTSGVAVYGAADGSEED